MVPGEEEAEEHLTSRFFLKLPNDAIHPDLFFDTVTKATKIEGKVQHYCGLFQSNLHGSDAAIEALPISMHSMPDPTLREETDGAIEASLASEVHHRECPGLQRWIAIHHFRSDEWHWTASS